MLLQSGSLASRQPWLERRVIARKTGLRRGATFVTLGGGCGAADQGAPHGVAYRSEGQLLDRDELVEVDALPSGAVESGWAKTAMVTRARFEDLVSLERLHDFDEAPL